MNAHYYTGAAFLRPFLEQALRRPSLAIFPAAKQTTRQDLACFSTTVDRCARKDGNKRRGESALHGKFAVPLRRYPRPTRFPQPVLDPTKRTRFQTDENHGLWAFFDDKKSPLLTPESLDSHGRAWTVSELRKKDFEDLWKLFWQCTKEVNRVATYERERKRLNIGYGQSEAETRIKEVIKTQKAIKHTLTERWYQFENAREVAMRDPEINLYANTAEGESAYMQAEAQYAEDAKQA